MTCTTRVLSAQPCQGMHTGVVVAQLIWWAVALPAGPEKGWSGKREGEG